MLRFFFCTFSGEDDYIIRRCDSSIQQSIALIGCFVMIVFLGCWVSASLFMAHLFAGNEWMSLLVGIIWAMLITNLYLLLLYTITPALMPTAKEKAKAVVTPNTETPPAVPLTNAAAIEIPNAQTPPPLPLPYPTMAVSPNAEMPPPIPLQYQTMPVSPNAEMPPPIPLQYQTMAVSPNAETPPPVPSTSATAVETPKTETSVQKPKPAFESPLSLSFIFRISLILLLAIIIIQPFNVLIFSPSFEASHHYAQEIRSILATHRMAWWTTFAGCMVFLLPVYWKYAIRNRGGFYEHKKLIETQLVQDNYQEFKEIYARIFKEKMEVYNTQTQQRLMPLLNKLAQANPEAYQKHYAQLQSELTTNAIVKYETWGDHPFKTIPKKETTILLSEKDFLKDFYSQQP